MNRTTPLWFRRLLVGGVATLTVGATGLTGLLTTAGIAGATSSFKITQLAGSDRFATAAAIAAAAFPSGAGTIIVASGLNTNLPDALAASYLAAQQNGGTGAPILLVNADSVPAETASAILSLKATNIIIVGGTSAVSSSVETTLTNGGAINVIRVAGTDRFLTADAIDSVAGDMAVGTHDTEAKDPKTAIIADGVNSNLVDALGASPLAAAGPYPMFLVNGPTGTLSSTDLSIMATDGITNAITVGGTAAIGPQIATELTAAGISSVNEAGSDRSATSDALAEYEIANYGFSDSEFNIAGGAQANLVDSLSGGPLGGLEKAPTLITDSPSDAASVVTFATANAATENSANLFGGSAGVDSTAEAAIIAAAQSVPVAPTTLPTLLSASITGTVTSGEVTPTSPAGTTVQYVFNQSMTGVALNSADFHVYTSADTEYGDGTAKVDASNSDAIDVLYTDTTPANLTTTAGAATLSLATVSSGAVTSASTGTNPDGSEPIGTASTVTSTKGVTTAPDLVSAVVNGPAATAGFTAVNVTFDKAAYVQAGAGTGNFGLVLTDGTPVTCSAPTIPVASGGPVSGETSVGGDGTTTLTLVCQDDPATPTTTLTNVARAIDLAGAVSTTGAAGGVLNQAEATSSPDATITTAPDLTGVAVNQNVNGSTTMGSITFTFNSAVTAPNPNDFVAFNGSAVTVPLTSDFAADTPTTVVFEATDTALETIVGASVAPASVTSAAGLSGAQEFNELGVASSTTSSLTPGVVTAPQLSKVALGTYTSATGTSETGGLYTFTQPVTSGVLATDLHLYDADGTELTCVTDDATVQSTATEVLCTSYVEGNSSTGTTAATTTQLSGAVLGTADQGAVTGSTAPDNHANPEGAASI